MTRRHPARTQTCGRPQANTRLSHAHKFLDAAELIATDIDDGVSQFVAELLAEPVQVAHVSLVGCLS